MPYTPPSHRSPASSASTSPDVSRRPSFQTGSKPLLPRSSSYLSKHRRTPSVTEVEDVAVHSQPHPHPANKGLASLGDSVRASPPPPQDSRDLIPKGAVISPPESATSGSDDEETPEAKGERTAALKDLRDAVREITKTSTPPPRPPPRHFSQESSQALKVSFSTSALSDLPDGSDRRRVGHVRSSTLPGSSILKNSSSSLTSDEDEFKPQMVRKKSGELVRPALRGHRRPSSMPGTPVFSKAVHFDSHLEHVRHFLQVDRPLAVSAGSSPADNYDSDSEYPFPKDGRPVSKAPPFEWEIGTPNLPADSLVRKTLPVRLEKVWLSSDQKSLLGSVAVANLAFHKQVVCRFTLDYWKTVSEVTAEYSHEIRPRETPLGRDRFTFSIKLSDMANLESKTLFFCVRYSVDSNEYWDNNNATNFQVDFKKKFLPQNGKNNFQGATSRPLNGLPRSGRRNGSLTNLRPVSMPAALDDFGNEIDVFNFDQPIHEYLGETESTGLRLKAKSTSSLASDNIARNVTSPSGAAFSNRYDFGASLNAAVKASKEPSKEKDDDKDALYMRKHVRGTTPPPTSPLAPIASLPSTSYEELVNKYCFVRLHGPVMAYLY